MNPLPVQSDLALDLRALGQRLQAGRTDAGLSSEEVAQRLHLPLATVAALESGQCERIGTPVYLKGFLKSYLKLVGLPESWAEEALRTARVEQSPPIMPAAGAVARRVSWVERYKWAATYVVGTALVLTGVQWLVSNTPQLGFPDTSRSVQQPAVPLPPPAATLSPAPPITPAIVDAPAVGANESGLVSGEAPVMASLAPFRVDTSEADVPASVLELDFDQQSWVEVRDESGERIVFQNVAAGERRAFSVGAPFSVLIGNARGVRAMVQGKPVGLDAFVRGNVARFNVAAQGDGWTPVAADREGRNGG